MIDKRELLLASLCKQHLLEPTDMASVVSDLCGLQAQFANNPGHALRIRSRDFTPEGWREGLVKTWTFRRTMHVVRRSELGLFLSALGVEREWNDDWGIPRRLKPELSERLLRWIRRGAGGREELKALCRRHGVSDDLLANVFHGWGGLLKEMCQRGLAAYAPGTEKRFVSCGRVRLVDPAAARRKILERYFRHLGPATMADCAVFTGFSRKAIAETLRDRPLPLESVICEGREYWFLGGWDGSRDIPSCLFLAGFDQLIMAYRDRSRLVDDRHRNDIVTNTGIVHPTVLLHGRLRAKWKRDGDVLRVTPFAALGRKERRVVEEEGRRLFGDGIRGVAFAGTGKSGGKRQL